MSPAAPLKTEPNSDRPDEVYQMLVDAHRDLSPEQSRLVNSKLILLLANHIGDITALSSAIEAARNGVAPKADATG
jgi:hypothetical protein